MRARDSKRFNKDSHQLSMNLNPNANRFKLLFGGFAHLNPSHIYQIEIDHQRMLLNDIFRLKKCSKTKISKIISEAIQLYIIS